MMVQLYILENATALSYLHSITSTNFLLQADIHAERQNQACRDIPTLDSASLLMRNL